MARLNTREWRPEEVASFSFVDCGAAISAGASHLSPTRPLLHQADYEPEHVMNVALMMDPKLDPSLQTTRLPSVVTLLERGLAGGERTPHLPVLGALTAGEACAALDRALQCLVAWQRGASLPQSLMGCLWTHPSSLATLCVAVGLPALWRHALPPFGEAEGGAGAPPPLPPPPPAAAGAAPLPRGGAQRLLTAALLAGVLAALKCAALGHSAVVGARIHDPLEEELVRALFDVDCAWSTPADGLAGALAGAEAALRDAAGGSGGGDGDGGDGSWAGGSGGADPDWAARTGRAAPAGAPFAELRVRGAEERAVLGAVGADAPAALADRLHFFRALLALHANLATEGAAPAAAPLAWGLRFDLPNASAAAADAARALDSFCGSSQLGDGAGGAGGGGGGGGGGAVSNTAGVDLSPGFFCGVYEVLFLGSYRPRQVPLLDWGASVASLKQLLFGASFVAALPALSSYGDEEMPAWGRPGGAAGAGGGAGGAAALAAAAALTGTDPMPIPRLSGLTDPPLSFPFLEPPCGGGGGARRPRVCLTALWALLSDFSARAPVTLVRAWLQGVLMVAPSAEAAAGAGAAALAAPGAPPLRPPAVSGAAAEDASFALFHAQSPVLFGSHTLAEVVSAHMARSGIPTEALWSEEGLRFQAVVTLVFSAALGAFAVSRRRFGRRLRFALRDWATVVHETQALDAKYRGYLYFRGESAARAAMAAAAAAGDGGKKKGAPAPPAPAARAPSRAAFTGAFFREDGRRLFTLKYFFACARALHWASGWAARLQGAWLCAGWENGLFAPAEWGAALMQEDHVLASGEQCAENVARARALAAGVGAPHGIGCGGEPFTSLSAEARSLWAAGSAAAAWPWHTLERVFEAEPPPQPAAEAGAPAAPAPAASGKGKKGKKGPPADGSGNGGGKDDGGWGHVEVLAEAAAWEAADKARWAAITEAGAPNARTVEFVWARARRSLLQGTLRLLAAAKLCGLWKGLEDEEEEGEGGGGAAAAAVAAAAEAGGGGGGGALDAAAPPPPPLRRWMPPAGRPFFRSPELTFSRRFKELHDFPNALQWRAYASTLRLDPAKDVPTVRRALIGDAERLLVHAGALLGVAAAALRDAAGGGALATPPPPPPAPQGGQAAAAAVLRGGSRATAAAPPPPPPPPPPHPTALAALTSARLAASVRAAQRAVVCNAVFAKQLAGAAEGAAAPLRGYAVEADEEALRGGALPMLCLKLKNSRG
jgi:hypothetical protein